MMEGIESGKRKRLTIKERMAETCLLSEQQVLNRQKLDEKTAEQNELQSRLNKIEATSGLTLEERLQYSIEEHKLQRSWIDCNYNMTKTQNTLVRHKLYLYDRGYFLAQRRNLEILVVRERTEKVVFVYQSTVRIHFSAVSGCSKNPEFMPFCEETDD